jgi:hypothetical protein
MRMTFHPLPAELAVHAAIAGHVVFALFIPELPVGFRPGVALGAVNAIKHPSTNIATFCLGNRGLAR